MDFRKLDKILYWTSKQINISKSHLASFCKYENAYEIDDEIKYLKSVGYLNIDDVTGTEISITEEGALFINNGGFTEKKKEEEEKRKRTELNDTLTQAQIESIKKSELFSEKAIKQSRYANVVAIVAVVLSFFAIVLQFFFPKCS